VPPLEPFDLRFYWDLAEAEEGETWYGNIVLGSQAGSDDDLGNIPVTLTRGADDVAFAADRSDAQVGDDIGFVVTIQPNLTTEDRTYDVEATIPPVFSFVEGSLAASGGDARVEGDRVRWTLAQPRGGDRGPATLGWRLRAEADANDSDVTSDVTSTVTIPGSEAVSEAVSVHIAASPDEDGDGIYDGLDNCTEAPNPSQCDSDLDRYGNDCDGDFDESGFVNYGDLAQLRVGFFQTNPDNELDMNCDGFVNTLDLGGFKAVFGAPPGPSGLVH
jgi:hypothetical protein